MSNNAEMMLRPAEAATLLGVSLAHLRRLASTGRLVTVRTLGGHRRYREDDVLAVKRWMERQEARAAEKIAS
jgi:excisionase family DNA binding protein